MREHYDRLEARMMHRRQQLARAFHESRVASVQYQYDDVLVIVDAPQKLPQHVEPARNPGRDNANAEFDAHLPTLNLN